MVLCMRIAASVGFTNNRSEMTMTRLNTITTSLFCFVLLILGGTTVASTDGHFIDKAVLTGRAEITSFLRTHASIAFEDATLGDFRIIDLDQDGKPDLIATIDSSGRGFYNHILVLHDNGGHLTVQEVDVWNMRSLNGAVQDLDNDGRPELLLRKSLTPYLGGRPMATWTAVFKQDGTQLVDQSASFPHFYEAVLSRLDDAASVSDAEGSERSYRKDLISIERDKVLRILGRSADAGLASALRWAHSEDPVYRIFALAILSELDGAEADSALKSLSSDIDPEVASRARVADAAKAVRVSPQEP
jgi:hypothetical protein